MTGLQVVGAPALERKPKTIVQLLTLVMKDVGAVGKDDTNPEQGFRFRGVDAVVNAASPALRRRGVVVVPTLMDVTRELVEVGGQRRPAVHAVVRVRYRFHGPAGDHLDAVTPGEAIDEGDKAVSKAMSVAFRIALLQALSLPTHDPDPDAAVYQRAPAETAPPPRQDSEGDRLRAAIGDLADRTGVTRRDLAERFFQTNQVDIRVAAPRLLEPVLAELQARAERMAEQAHAAAEATEPTEEAT